MTNILLKNRNNNKVLCGAEMLINKYLSRNAERPLGAISGRQGRQKTTRDEKPALHPPGGVMQLLHVVPKNRPGTSLGVAFHPESICDGRGSRNWRPDTEKKRLT